MPAPKKKIGRPVTRKSHASAAQFVGRREKSASSVARTSAGLREALFQEIESLRAGESNPTQAMAVAKLSQQIVSTIRVEIEFATKLKPGEAPAAKEMPAPLRLVDAPAAA